MIASVGIYGTFANASEIVAKDSATKQDVVHISANAHSPIDDVIKKQLQAIRERNDRTAYELNANIIQDEYEDPQSYMRNLRRQKSALYNHVGYEIIPSSRPESKFHKVKLIDKFGKSVMALFKMEQNDKGEWRTNDIVVLTPSDDPI